MQNKIIVSIGTKNQAKITAVKDAFKVFFKKADLDFKGLQVDSEVGDQPIGIDNTTKGAIIRAKTALSLIETDSADQTEFYGVGIEAGLIPIAQATTKYMDMQFTAIINQNRLGLGVSSGFEYPASVINDVISGKAGEIGDVMEKLSGIKNCKEKNGAIGYLTNNIVTRTDILKNGVIMALLPFINQDLYKS